MIIVPLYSGRPVEQNGVGRSVVEKARETRHFRLVSKDGKECRVYL